MPALALAATAHLTVMAVARPAAADLDRLWAVSDGTKLGPQDTGNELAGGNAVFDPATGTVVLFGLRNETVAFQLVLEGGNTSTEGLSVEVSDIGPIANREVSDAPGQYYLGRHIEIFEEKYVQVEHRSTGLVWLSGSEAQPDVHEGLIPDPLVPHRRPVTVPARQLRSFWVDVWIDRDTPPGLHRGTVELTRGGGDCGLDRCRLAVELEVGEGTLPDTTDTGTMLFYSAGSPQPEYALSRYFDDPSAATSDQIASLRLRHHHLARRHRVTLFWGLESQPTDELRDLMSGAAFTRERGYDGPGLGIGLGLQVLGAYGGELSPEQAHEWNRWLGQFGPDVDAFLYAHDEPEADATLIAEINDKAARARPIRSFVTSAYDPRLDVDIFAAPPNRYDAGRASRAEGDGRQQWIYNGIRPHSGTFAIDDVAISPRVNPWIQHRYGIGRWFYWESTYYLDFQGQRGQIDVWTRADNFRNQRGDAVNGDGLLFYPGRDRLFPDSDHGIDRPLPSIRLKNWRRGIEDAEYLVLARTAGHGQDVDRLLAALIPEALADVDADEPVPWPEDGDRWQRARRVLFDLLAGASSPGKEIAALGRPEDSWSVRARRTVRRWLDPFLRSRKRRIVSSVAAAAAVVIAALLVARRRRRRRSRNQRS